MSRVYKSSYVSVGTPKPLINNFRAEEKPAASEAGVNGGSERDPGEAANSIIEDAKQMYLRIIEEANAEAQAIMEEANREAERLMNSARENGHMEGFEAGYLEGKAQSRSIIEEASEIRSFLDERRESLYQEVEAEILQLVIEISEKVIGEELTQTREALLSLIKQALMKCAFKKKLVLKTSHEDFDFVNENKDRICMMVEGISDIDIVPDLSLSKGSCIIETPSGEINSSVDVQIKEVEKIFEYLLRNE